MRYFQVAPSHGNEDFEPNTHWGDIVEIYNLDVQLRALLFEGIHLAEISARTAFAYSEANIHSPYEEYLATDAYKRPPNPTIKATNELILSELHRSREPYIAKFRKGCTDGNQLWTDDVPVWAAVETLSLGTLSKAISFRNDGNAVYQGTCKGPRGRAAILVAAVAFFHVHKKQMCPLLPSLELFRCRSSSGAGGGKTARRKVERFVRRKLSVCCDRCTRLFPVHHQAA